MTKSSGGYAASGGGYGYAAVELIFPGEPGETYTAVGNHRARLQMWDYVDTFPREIYYYDNWYFTSYEAQNIYQPWYYYFGSPGNYVYRRRDDIVSAGRTHDSVSTTSLADDINFRTVSNDVNSNVANFVNGANRTATVNLNGASHPVCGDNRTAFNIYVNFTLPPNAISIYDSPRTTISNFEKQQFSYYPPFYFNNVYFTQGTATMVIRARQADPSKPDKGFSIRIAGGLSGGGSYSGKGRVNFICPSPF